MAIYSEKCFHGLDGVVMIFCSANLILNKSFYHTVTLTIAVNSLLSESLKSYILHHSHGNLSDSWPFATTQLTIRDQ